MDLEQLKLILQTVAGVSNGAAAFAEMWIILEIIKALIWPVAVGIVGYTVYRVVKVVTRVDELERAGGSTLDKRSRLLDGLKRAWLDRAITGEEYKALLTELKEKTPW